MGVGEDSAHLAVRAAHARQGRLVAEQQQRLALRRGAEAAAQRLSALGGQRDEGVAGNVKALVAEAFQLVWVDRLDFEVREGHGPTLARGRRSGWRLSDFPVPTTFGRAVVRRT